MQNNDTIWQTKAVVDSYLTGVRGAIPLAKTQLDIMLRIIRTAQPQVNNFLDLGCGDGILGRVILNEYPDAQGIFLDFSEPMIAAAKAQLGEQAANIEFIIQDYGDKNWVNALPEGIKFDVIVSGFSIHHQVDQRKQEIYQEIFNLLTSGGVFMNLEHVSSRTPWIASVHDELFIDCLYAFHRRNNGEKTRAEIAQEYYDRPDKTANILAPVEIQCQWLREIGFTHVDCYLKVFELSLFGGIKP